MTRSMIDASTGSSLYMKITNETFGLLKVMASNDHHCLSNNGPMKNGVYELDTLNAILAINATLQK